jgi:hypothetical protein
VTVEFFGSVLVAGGVLGGLWLGAHWLWRNGKLARFGFGPPPPKPPGTEAKP